MFNSTRKNLFAFISILAVAITVAVAVSILADLRYGYSALVVFSLVATSEGVILGVYQIVFVEQMTTVKFVNTETERLKEVLELFQRFAEAEAESKQEIINQLEQKNKELENSFDAVEFYGEVPDSAMEKLEEAVERNELSGFHEDNRNEN